MNRLRGRKKAKEAKEAKEETMPRPSAETESSGPFKMFGRSKKPVEEPKVEVDLNAALPPSDDFRTSLLMTGLSARFSMLREQDDPSSKLGKASDDSVLYPKRQSRMDFGLGSGLHDIAEDSSFKAPNFGRMDSFQSSDDAASMSGSIMNRGKPTDGNNLFGGRQKIYKISAAGGSARTLYEEDVAQSSFQRYRQQEREKQSFEDDGTPDAGYDPNSLQPDSPYMQEFNRRRETSSTTSSIPSAPRNSTAATSIASQPASSFKDSSGAPSNVASSVTRTRRLYEQSLNQDIQDQQSSTVSRFDSMSRNRPVGTRTPDHNASSPTMTTAPDRFNERRPMMSKSSAPNLRTFSPPTTSSQQASPAESASRFSGAADAKTGPTTSPPLSPPISEAEEFSSLSIAPGDRGKATALGLFNRPAQQYDENKYAQRQLQLQQGRDTPTMRNRNGSDASLPTSRSRSSSSVQRVSVEKPEANAKSDPNAYKEALSPTFLDIDEDEEEEEPAPKQQAPQSSQSGGARPDDQDHPALRKATPPEPLSITKTDEDGNLHPTSEDSPTLPSGSGLSGMVKQHMRNDSNASSVYDSVPHDMDRVSHYIPNGNAAASVEQLRIDSNPWDTTNNPNEQSNQSVSNQPEDTSIQEPSEADDAQNDEFARHLADGARRVRERLTTYVDSDHSRSTSPSATPHAESNQDLPPPRTNAFGTLRSKSSRGSLADRSRERSRSRAGRMLQVGLGAATFASSPSPSRTQHDAQEQQQEQQRQQQTVEPPETSPTEKDEAAHAGLKAFRQARRELQRMKEHEVQQRHQAQKASGGSRRSEEQHDRAYPPVSYNRMPSGDSSRPGSRARSDRDRSGSEASSGGQPHYRPRMRTETPSFEEYQYPDSPTGPTNNMHPAERSSGDARRPPAGSPHLKLNDGMPRQGGQRGPPGAGLTSTASTPGLPISPSRPSLPVSPSMPPPLPPINPRRKGVGSPSPRGDDGSNAQGPSRTRGGRPLLLSDDEAGPAQFRQRLRKVPSEANGVRGRAERAPPRPPPQTTVSSGNMTGGMI